MFIAEEELYFFQNKCTGRQIIIEIIFGKINLIEKRVFYYMLSNYEKNNLRNLCFKNRSLTLKIKSIKTTCQLVVLALVYLIFLLFKGKMGSRRVFWGEKKFSVL